MHRRDFVRNGLQAAALLGTQSALGRWAFGGPPPDAPFDLVAVRGGEPDTMFDRGIEALGGMKSFVRKGQKVVVKPNLGWDVSPERAATTNPRLIARIVQHCREAGARQVYVFDHTCDDWEGCYETSGIERAARDAGATMAPADAERYYQKVTVPRGRSLKEALEHELMLEADVIINVPVLKNHGGARLTMAMKNLMGVVWDRGFWHRNDLHQCIADFATYRQPHLNVLDAYRVMKRNGPRGVSVNDVVTMKAQLLSTDMVTIDTAGAKLFEMDPGTIRHIRLAGEMKAGRGDLENLRIHRIVI